MDKNKENNPHQNKTGVADTTAANEHTDMPVKTPGTDTKENTVQEEGLNHANTDINDIEPGTTPPGDE